MKDGSILNKIKSMIINDNTLVIVNLILSVFFTLVGTCAIIFFIGFLYQAFNFNYLFCLLMIFVLPNAYSIIINSILEHIDNKFYCILLKNNCLREEKIEDYNLKDEKYFDNIKLRFERLTIENQLKILSFIKDNIPEVSKFEELNQDDMLLLMNELDVIELDLKKNKYTRKKTID